MVEHTNDISQKILSRDLNDRKECFEVLLNSLNKILFEKYSSKDIKNEKQHYSNLIAQKAMLNGYTIVKLLNGIDVLNVSTGKNTSIADPSSMVVLCRSLLESYLTYNHINSVIDAIESDFRFKIWLQFGLRSRIKAVNSVVLEKEEHKSIFENDKKNREEILSEIKNNKFYKYLPDEKKTEFLDKIKRDWKIIIQDKEITPQGWQNLLNNTGIKPSISLEVYNFLSWYSHTTCISVFQLRDMYTDGFADFLKYQTLNQSSFFISMFISDIVRFDSDYKKGYTNLTQVERDYINIYNYIVRDDGYMIDPIE